MNGRQIVLIVFALGFLLSMASTLISWQTSIFDGVTRALTLMPLIVSGAGVLLAYYVQEDSKTLEVHDQWHADIIKTINDDYDELTQKISKIEKEAA
jgi:hypothetical protein